MNYDRLLLLLFFCVLLSACASPAQKFDDRAVQYGFIRLELPGQAFTHISYRNSAVNKQKRLHIYIEGDGMPWWPRPPWVMVMADPTPRKGLMLNLMALDSQPSLYLGRPCYFGQAQFPACYPLLWTQQRYSQQVVLSMVTALKKYLILETYDELVFFGHSGGGALVMLIAPYFNETAAVITLAANLDINAWTDLHDYSRLEGSLNPATMPSLPSYIMQIHYAGEKDQNVPAFIIKKGLINQEKSQFRSLKAADHTCCWQQIWQQLLNELHLKKL